MTVQEQRHGPPAAAGVDAPSPGAGYIPVRVPREAGPPPVTPPPTVPTPAVPPPAAPAEPRSMLTRLVLAALLVAVGVLGMIDLAGARFPVSAYFAVPLAVVAVGLIIGGWYGRARGLIAVGAVLAVPLAVVATAETWDLANVGGNVTWKPASVQLLDDRYSLDVGNGVLDLSDLDFTGQTEQVEVRVDVGNLTIVLPPTVDAEVTAQVDVGSSNVFGHNANGIGQSGQTVVDVGADGPGGGKIVITASVDVGDLEVRR
jgi:hypothetical protein